MNDWMVSLQEQLKNKTDDKTAAHVITRLLPNMLADLNRMAKSRRAGESVSEEYRLDDGSLAIILTGEATPDGVVINEAKVL